MRKYSVWVVAALMVGGCTELVQTSERASTFVRGSVFNSAGKIQKYVQYDPGPTELQAPQTSFCYKMASDIVCYEEPQPHLLSKLYGYQDPHGRAAQFANANSNSMNESMMQTGELIDPAMVTASAPMMSVSSSGAAPASAPPLPANPPFFVKEAPYVKADGSSSTEPSGPPSLASRPAKETSVSTPKSLMPRY